jgi:succinate dehydrogenase/fumarate reductase-like Fe-S protein
MARRQTKPQARRIKSDAMTIEQIVKLATMSYIAAHEAAQIKIEAPTLTQVTPPQSAVIAPQEWYYSYEHEKLKISNSQSTNSVGPFQSFSQAKQTALKQFTNLAAQARKITKS